MGGLSMTPWAVMSCSGSIGAATAAGVLAAPYALSLNHAGHPSAQFGPDQIFNTTAFAFTTDANTDRD